jgi:hypothetical protein
VKIKSSQLFVSCFPKVAGPTVKTRPLVGCLKMSRFTYPDNDWQSTWHEEIQGTAVPHLPTLMNMTLDKHGCQALVEVKSMSKM